MKAKQSEQRGKLKIPNTILDGMPVEVLRKTDSGSLIVQALETRGAWKKGHEIQVEAEEFKPA